MIDLQTTNKLQLATITPKSLLPVGPIALGLAHLLKDDKELQKKWKELEVYKILDNSAFELGSAHRIEDMVDLAFAIDAQEIVLPDEFRDGKKTLERVYDALSYLHKDVFANDTVPFRVMAVPQGKTFGEWLRCYEALAADPRIDVIAINRDSSKYCGTRVDLLHFLEQRGMVKETKEYHLLGMQDNILELEVVNDRFDWVRSIDSCFPWLVAKHNALFGFSDFSKCIDIKKDIHRSDFKKSIDFDDKVYGIEEGSLEGVLQILEDMGVSAMSEETKIKVDNTRNLCYNIL
jgi:hypothetical protein